MAQGDRQRIGGVVGLRILFEIEKSAHHKLDLVLVGSSIAHHRFFDLCWRIFKQRHGRLRRCQQYHTSGVAKLECTLDIERMKQVLNHDYRG